jgi:phage tail-like protein
MKVKLAASILAIVVLVVVASSMAMGATKVDNDQIPNGVNAAPFVVNPYRFDPYKNHKFRVKWDNQYVYGISKVSGLIRSTEAIDSREGSDSNIERISPGLTNFEPIVLERGLTHDPAFENWANLVWYLGASPGNEMSLANFRKDIVIELYNEAGQKVMAWFVYRCWPSEYVALGELDASKPDIAVERLTLQHEGWERDTEVTEPTQP